MASLINADNGVVSGSAGVKTTADSSGVLALQTNGTTALSISTAQVVSFTNSPTYTAGTANGVAYLNASKVLTTGSGFTYSSTGNLVVAAPSSGDAFTATAVGTAGAIKGVATTVGSNSFIASPGSASGVAYSFDTNGSVGMYQSAVNNIDFGVLGSSAININATRNVTINAPSSGSALIASAASTTAAISIFTAGNLTTAGPSSYLRFNYNNNAAAAGYIGFGGVANQMEIYNYLNGPISFVTNNTTKLVIDGGGYVGVGITPSAWTTYTAAQVQQLSLASYTNGDGRVSNNCFYDNGNWKYITTRYAVQYLLDAFNGVHKWNIAPSGTAGNTITFTTAMTLDSSGNLGIGTSSPGAVLTVENSAGITCLLRRTTATSYTSLRLYNDQNSSTRSLEIDYSGSTYSGALITGGPSGEQAAIGTTGAYPLVLYTSNTARAVINSTGNFAVGMTPSPWGSGRTSIQVYGSSTAAYFSGGTANCVFGNNFYHNGTNDVFTNATWYAAYYAQDYLGNHSWTSSTAASASANSAVTFSTLMTLTQAGNLGIGTSSPGSKLSVEGANSTDGPTSFLTNLRNSGAQTSGVGTGIAFSQKMSSFNAVLAVVEGVKENGTSDNYASAMVFSTRQNAANLAERMRLDSSGNLLVGTTSSSSSAGAGFKVTSPVAGHWDAGIVTTANNASYSCWDIYSTATSSYRFYVTTTGVVNAVSTTISAISDQRLKENIRDLDDGLATVMALKPRKFDWKESKGAGTKNARGFIAQEFEQVFPDLIDEWKDPAPEGEEPYKAVRADLIPTLVKAMQEQQALIESLTARLNSLENK
jgi:hypothetical protein